MENFMVVLFFIVVVTLVVAIRNQSMRDHYVNPDDQGRVQEGTDPP